MRTILALLASVACTSLVPAMSEAAKPGEPRPFSTGFDFPDYQPGDEAATGGWLERAVGAGAGIVRIGGGWAGVAPATPPPGFDPSDPTSPAYRWAGLDAKVRAAASRGLQILFTVTGAPAWAEGPGRPARITPGTWRPQPAAYGAFARALAARYSGAFPDPLQAGATLPRVTLYEAWNEPNLDVYLAPQWVGKRLVGPKLYRGLLNSFYAGVKSAQPGATVLAGGMAPFGDLPGGRRTPPVQFLRELLCLRGGRLRPLPCPRPARLDALSHHPIAVGSPMTSGRSPLDASTPDLGRLTRVLRRAERERLVRPAGRRPLWVTEFWYDSSPPDPRGVPLARHARWYEQALYLFWKAGARVAIALQLRDSPPGQGYPYTSQSGVHFVDGRPKPAYGAFRFPLVASRLGREEVEVWGIAPEPGRVRIQARRPGGWRTLAVLRARGRSRPFLTRLRLSGPTALRATLGGERSLVWRQG